MTSSSTHPSEPHQEHKVILFTETKGTATITLNCPKKLNALSDEMLIEMQKIVSSYVDAPIDYGKFVPVNIESYKYKNIPKVLFMVPTGNNFSSGGNVVQVYKAVLEDKKEIVKEGYQLILTLIQTLLAMKPIQVVFWKGFVMGGGVGISINAPIRIATDTTQWAMPECQLGHFPDVGASYFLTHMINNNPKLGLYVGLTGYRVKGRELIEFGIATHYIKSDQLESAQKAIEALCDSKDSVTVEDVSEELKKFGEISHKDNFKFPNEDLINEVFEVDSIFQIFKRLEVMKEEGDERKKKFATITLKILEAASPISILIFTEMCKRAINLKNIKECYIRDFESSEKVMVEGDFREGVRAILIDKDKKFNWKYKSINDIKNPDEIIKEFLPWA